VSPSCSNIVVTRGQRPQVLLPNQVPPPQQILVKRGYREFSTPRACIVSFNRLPVWLWTLRPVEWLTVWVSQEDLKTLVMRDHPTLIEQFKGKIQPISPVSSVIAASIWWSSGTLAFVSRLNVPAHPILHVRWVAPMGCRSPNSMTLCQWLSVSRTKVDGAWGAPSSI
jgi:hypothetical protein